MQRTALALLLTVLYAVIGAVVAHEVGRHWAGASSSSSEYDKEVRALVARAPAAPDDGALDEVGGHEAAKAELRRSVVLPMRHPRVFYEGPRSVRPPRGVLLHGPPGTGKTMLARAAARASGASLLALSAAALESKWYGDSPKLLQAAFRLARGELAPCILFIDEIDGVGRARQESDQSCVYSLKCELLRNVDEMDGHPVALLACTNCPQQLDAALRRRFQRVLEVGRPSRGERLEILRRLADGAASATLERVADATDGLTGSDLAALYEDASARRMDPARLEKALARGGDGHALSRRLGPLAWRHWREAAAARGLRSFGSPEKCGAQATSTPDPPSAGR